MPVLIPHMKVPHHYSTLTADISININTDDDLTQIESPLSNTDYVFVDMKLIKADWS
jgi:hypothetical protein